MVLWSLENAWGGEIFVPKIPSYRITDLAEAIAPECEHHDGRHPPGREAPRGDDHRQRQLQHASTSARYYAILPSGGQLRDLTTTARSTGGAPVAAGLFVQQRQQRRLPRASSSCAR